MAQSLIGHRGSRQGWCNFSETPLSIGALEVWYWSNDPADLPRVPPADRLGWVGFLLGENPGFPEEILAETFTELEAKVAEMRADPTMDNSRLSDDVRLSCVHCRACVVASVHWWAKRARVSLTLRLICGYLLRSLQPFLTCIYGTLSLGDALGCR